MFTGHPALDLVGALIIALFVAWFVLLFRLGRELRSRHPELWQRLGEPEWLRPGGRRPKGLMRFIFQGQFREARDPAVDRIGVGLRVVFVAYVLLLAVWTTLAFG